MPVRKLEDDGTWLHPSRLPLLGGWDGHCCAPGHEGAELSREELKECNLGYVANCPRLPQDRSSDAARFAIVGDTGTRLAVCFVCELNHHPVQHGTLEYDVIRGLWQSPHSDARLQKMAECYVESYLERRRAAAAS